MAVMKTKITARPGSSSSDKEIARISAALKAIEKRHGVLTPKIVVAAAALPSSPIHKHFEWNDGEAASRYRLWQARQLIARVFVINESSPNAIPVRAFVNLELAPPSDENEEDEEQANSRAYLSIGRIKGKQDFESQVLRYALMQLVGWKKRFGAFKQFLGVKREIDKLEIG